MMPLVLYQTKVIPAFRTVEFLFFAAPGQTANGSPIYNLQELVPAAAGGIVMAGIDTQATLETLSKRITC